MRHCFRLVYCSKSNLPGDLDQANSAVRNILTTSRANNASCNLTGALLFGGTCFAQVLEGSFDAVTATMERIERDPRHRDVTVLQLRAVPHPSFPNWSMAYAGLDPADDERAGKLLTEALDSLPEDAARLHGLLRHLAVAGERWIAPAAPPRHGFPNPAAAD